MLIDLLRQQIGREKLTSGMFFHQDNASAHTSTVALVDIQKCGFQLVQDPLCSPNLAPSDHYLFQKMKKELGGHNVARDDDVMNAMNYFLRDQDGTFYTEVIRLLQDRWTVLM